MDNLIAKYFLNDLSLEEQRELAEWMHSDEKNTQVFRQLETYWKHHKDDLEQEDLEMRLRLYQRMHQGEGIITPKAQPEPISQSKTPYLRWVAVFAMVAAGLYYYLVGAQKEITPEQSVITYVEKISLPGQKITTILPDGTKVKLNADSKLIVPSAFVGDTREVELQGEAFFDVKRDEAHPFIIKTSAIKVKVLGTSFNVKAYSETAQRVAVKTGKVAVGAQEGEEVMLIPNEMVELSEDHLAKGTITKGQDPFGWTEQKLTFDNESFADVVRKIERWYGVKLTHQNKVTINKKYTANYENPTLVEVMDVLAFVYRFKYDYDQKAETINIK